MDSGYYAAMTGLVARTQALDTAAANLANAQTPGYRAEREFFRSVAAGAGRVRLAARADGEQLRPAGRRPAQHGSGRASADRQSARSGHRGPGFLSGPDPQWPALHARRRLSPRPERAVGDHAGEPVLSATGQPIPIPPGEVTVGADGVLSVAGGAVATVGIFTFPAGTD